MDDGRPISYLALGVGTPVVSTTGAQFGAVEHVLQVPEEDLFDGIVVKVGHNQMRYVERDQITDITTTRVRCDIADDAVASLPAPDGTLVLHPDLAYGEGHSLSARYARAFGRLRWKELEKRRDE